MSTEQFQSFEELVDRDFRRNVTAVVAFETMWGFGLPFTLATIMIPAYLNFLAAPKVVIGVASALGAILMPLQLFSERLVGGIRRKKSSWFLYMSSGVAFMAYGFLGFILPAQPNTYRIIFFIGASILFLGTIYLAQPAYWSLLTDICPLRKRGRLLGLRTTGMGLAGLINVLPARWVYQHFPAPTNFHIALIVAGFFFIIASTSILFIRDHIDPDRLEIYQKPNSTPVLREIYGLLVRLWKTPNYRVFIFFIIVLVASFSLAPFLITYAGDCLKLKPDQNRLFNLAFLIACPLAGVSIGVLADRWGYRLTAIIVAFFSVTAFILALSAHNMNTVFFAYGLYCCIMVTISTIMLNMSIELLPQENPSHLLAAGNMFTLIPTVLVPALCGRILDVYRHVGILENGYLTVFIIAIVLAVIGGLGMLMLVQEPRTGRVYVIKILNRP
jgi:MFS family permease